MCVLYLRGLSGIVVRQARKEVMCHMCSADVVMEEVEHVIGPINRGQSATNESPLGVTVMRHSARRVLHVRVADTRKGKERQRKGKGEK